MINLYFYKNINNFKIKKYNLLFTKNKFKSYFKKFN